MKIKTKIKTKTKIIIIVIVTLLLMIVMLRINRYRTNKINNFWLEPAPRHPSNIIQLNPIHKIVKGINTLSVDNGGDTVLLLIYGRKKSIHDSGPLYSAFHHLPATIMLFEFSGVFDGKKTFETMISDGQTVCSWIRTEYPNKKIVAVGHSFGASVALYLDVDAYCLIGGVHTVSRLTGGLPFLDSKYDVKRALDLNTFKHGAKLLVMHGILDPYLLLEESEKLVEHANKVGLNAKLALMRVGHSFWETDPVPPYNAMYDFISGL
jgi:dienelactone hydrolase